MFSANCYCWRSRSKMPSIRGSWGYSGGKDAIDFQTDGEVILLGYRLWGVRIGSTTFQVTIGLYNGNTLIAERNGSYPTNSSINTFEVYFLQDIMIHANVTYTATATITTSASSVTHGDGMASASCFGITVSFSSSSKDENGSSTGDGQIPALILHSSQCENQFVYTPAP